MIASILAVVVLILSTCGGNIALNNWRLKRFANQLYEYTLPDGATLKEAEARVGVLTGNGNHCDFAAIVIIQSSMSFERVKDYYTSLKIAPAIRGSDAEQHLEVKSPTPENIFG